MYNLLTIFKDICNAILQITLKIIESIIYCIKFLFGKYPSFVIKVFIFGICVYASYRIIISFITDVLQYNVI